MADIRSACSPETLGQGMAALGEELRAYGRDPVQVAVSVAMSITSWTPRRHALDTEPADVLRNARAYAGAGVETPVVSANTSDPRAARATIGGAGGPARDPVTSRGGL